MEQCFNIFRVLNDDPRLPQNIRHAMQKNVDVLHSFIFIPITQLIDELSITIRKLGIDLEKSEPLLEYNQSEIFINHQQDTLLRNCMTHLIRNALDHGIEAPDERRQAGKPESGHIQIKIEYIEKEILIRIQDDGRRIAIGKLRQIGVKKGILQPDDSPEKVSQIIFHAGLSTAKQVSQISGRGVGMDAVRRFIQESGGHIEVILQEPLDEAGEYYRCYFELRLPEESEI